MKNYFNVSFEHSENVYCTNLAIAENEADVAAHYAKYAWYKITEAMEYEVESAKRKGMPVVECEHIDPEETTEETTVEEVKEEPKPATETKKPVHFENVTLLEVREAIEHRKNRSAWSKGVNEYALELLEELEEAISQGYVDSFDHLTNETLTAAMLNGAKEWRKPTDEFAAWNVYSWGGSSLIYDGDIAERLCTPSELKKKKGGDLRPNSREEWLDVQTRALYQAAQRIKRTASRLNKGMKE